MKHFISITALLAGSSLLFSSSIPFMHSKTATVHPSASCKHVEISMEKEKNRYYSFDFKKGYVYGSNSNQVVGVGMNGGTLKFAVDAKGQVTDMETLHFDYDEEGVHRITNTNKRFGDEVFDFSTGNKVFKVESKDGKGSWSRGIFTYDNNGDPVTIKMQSEEFDSNQKKVRAEDMTATLSFFPDKPSLDKGSVVMASMISNLLYAFYRHNMIVSQHLLKHILVSFTVTSYEIGDPQPKSFTNESDYVYDFDEQGRPVKILINSSGMGHTIPTRTFIVNYSNCQ